MAAAYPLTYAFDSYGVFRPHGRFNGLYWRFCRSRERVNSLLLRTWLRKHMRGASFEDSRDARAVSLSARLQLFE